MKAKSKLLLLFIVILCTIIGYIVFNYFNITDEKVKRNIIKSLNNKYGDNFFEKDFISKDDSVDFYQMYLYSEKYPDNKIYATCKIVNHKCIIADNYQSYSYEDEILELLDGIISNNYQNYKFFIDNNDFFVLEKKYDNLDEYLNEQNNVSFTLFVESNEYNKRKYQIERLRQQLQNNKIKASIILIYVNNATFKNINTENYKDFYDSLEEDIISYTSFSMNENYEFIYNIWG